MSFSFGLFNLLYFVSAPSSRFSCFGHELPHATISTSSELEISHYTQYADRFGKASAAVSLIIFTFQIISAAFTIPVL